MTWPKRDHFCSPGRHCPPPQYQVNIAEANQLLFPLLIGWSPPFKETLHWLQFAYTPENTEAYVASASTVIVPSTVLEGDPISPAL